MVDHENTIILVVEDEAPMARAIHDRLKSEGFKVSLARDGKEGLKLVSGKEFDVVLMDIAMPAMTGMEMMKQMRKESLKKAPIIIYTNMVPDDEILAGVARDKPTYYLSKTEHSLDYVVEMIDKILESKEES